MFPDSRLTNSARVISPSNPAVWRAILPASRSVFGSLEFCSVVQKYQDLEPCLFAYTAQDADIAYPFFLRNLAELPYAEEVRQGWDTKSPEYTGPVPLSRVSPGAARSFRQAFHHFCRDMGIVAEFAHLHPWANNRPLLESNGLTLDRQIIYVDLTLSIDKLWEDSFSRSCRKNIRRAQNENVRVFQARSEDEIREFHRIYTLTMQRNDAAQHYYFSLDFFKDILEALEDHAWMMLAEYKGQIIAGTLYLHDDHNIYSYLGGADHDYQHVRPTNAVVYETICLGQQHGKRRLIMGGGYRPNDGIFNFKSSFSPLRADFYVYKRVHLQSKYQDLCRRWIRHYAAPLTVGRFFPLYRSVPEPPVILPVTGSNGNE
jgi:hypothetical protein